MTDHPPTATPYLRQLGAAYSAGELSAAAFLQEACSAVAQRLGCDRVSVWRFDGEAEQRVLRCVALHEQQRSALEPGTTLAATDCGDYVEVLARDGIIDAPQAFDDRRLTPLLPVYLQPLDVRSLLDVMFSVNGQAFGTLCCHQIGRIRRWLPQEVAELRRVGSVISLALTRPPEAFDPTQPLPLLEVPDPTSPREPRTALY